MIRTYPHGVTCWVDVRTPDVDAATGFYGQLVGWHFAQSTPIGAPQRYAVASLGGREVAGIGGPTEEGEPAQWRTFVAIDDCDRSAAQVLAAGGRILQPPQDAGPGGRSAIVVDPQGATLVLWQARRRAGAQLTAVPGAWLSSDLHTSDPDGAMTFYERVFEWHVDLTAPGEAKIRVPGSGAHRAAMAGPGGRLPQRPAGNDSVDGADSVDVIGTIGGRDPGERSHWHVTFCVADLDTATATVERLGGTVLARGDEDDEDDDPLTARVLDPHGAAFSIRQAAPHVG